jgi:ribosomal protein S18 acetylase RimI-like enzyme
MPLLRPYRASDWEAFLLLDLEAAEGSLAGASDDVRRDFVQRWPAFLRSRYGWTADGPTTDGSVLLVCEADDGTHAGHVWLTEQNDFFTGERKLFVTTVAVAPAQRRRGIGRLLMEAAEAQARQRGLATLALGVEAGNASAISLYESLGFVTRRLAMDRRL